MVVLTSYELGPITHKEVPPIYRDLGKVNDVEKDWYENGNE